MRRGIYACGTPIISPLIRRSRGFRYAWLKPWPQRADPSAPRPCGIAHDGVRQPLSRRARRQSARQGDVPLPERRTPELALHPEGAQGPAATGDDALSEASRELVAGGWLEPDGLHQGREDHELGRRT